MYKYTLTSETFVAHTHCRMTELPDLVEMSPLTKPKVSTDDR